MLRLLKGDFMKNLSILLMVAVSLGYGANAKKCFEYSPDVKLLSLT